ncbi:MAG: adenylate/guanylate cyclase domain-containing protein [Pseudomonadota bacterium]
MKWRSARWAVLLIALIWAAGLGALHLSGRLGPLDRAEAVTLDWRHLLAAPPGRPDDLLIFAIDDEAVAMAGGYPIRRRLLATSIERLAEAGAAAIGIDVLLLDPAAELDDATLEQTLAAYPVVLAAGGRAGGPIIVTPDWTDASEQTSTSREQRFPVLERLARPLPRFRAVATDAPALVIVDSSGTPRFAPLLFTPEDAPATVAPSFALSMAGLVSPSPPRFGPEAVGLGREVIPLDSSARLALRFLGPAGTVETRSLARLWDDTPLDEVSGRVVLIGATATGAGDAFSTPFDARLPGVEVLATAITNLLDGTALRRDQTVRWIDASAAVVLTLIAVMLVLTTAGWIGPVASAAVVAAWLGITALAFAWAGWWMSAALPIAATVPPILLALAVRQTLERRDRRQLGQTAQAYSALQSPVISRALTADPSFLQKPRQQEATIMFLDIVGFTPLADRLGPAESRTFLASFHNLVADAVNATGGYVASWLGDGMMVVFGLPEPNPSDTANALATALDILDHLPGTPGSENDPIRLKIGITVGAVMVSRLGGGGHEHISAVGMTVNRAARLMAAAGAAGLELIADQEVRERLPDSLASKLKPLDQPLSLAGFSAPVTAVALISDRVDPSPEGPIDR